MNLLEFRYREPDRRSFEKLRKAHTRQLMNWLESARACGQNDYEIEFSGIYTTVNQLKAELANREHVPNKDEAKVIRQKKS